MKWLEIIEIRITNSDHELIEFYLQQLFDQIKETKQEVRILNKLNLDTDFSIHLMFDSIDTDSNGSPLGQNIVSALKEFGLVNHSIWIQMKMN